MTAFRSLLRQFKERHERKLAIRALSAMNDHQLADIGIERGFVVDAVDGNVPHLRAWMRS